MSHGLMNLRITGPPRSTEHSNSGLFHVSSIGTSKDCQQRAGGARSSDHHRESRKNCLLLRLKQLIDVQVIARERRKFTKARVPGAFRA